MVFYLVVLVDTILFIDHGGFLCQGPLFACLKSYKLERKRNSNRSSRMHQSLPEVNEMIEIHDRRRKKMLLLASAGRNESKSFDLRIE